MIDNSDNKDQEKNEEQTTSGQPDQNSASEEMNEEQTSEKVTLDEAVQKDASDKPDEVSNSQEKVPEEKTAEVDMTVEKDEIVEEGEPKAKNQEGVKTPDEAEGSVSKEAATSEEEYEFEEDHEDDSDHEEDYTKLNKDELLERIKDLTGHEIAEIKENKVEAVHEAFFHIIEEDKQKALEEFLAEEGNEEGDFEYIKDKDIIQKFNTYYFGFKDQKKKFQHDLHKNKEGNLKKKYELLERLRQFVDEDEDNVGVKTLKDIEQEWKDSEPIPNNYSRELWANFNALRDRFYDKRSIFFELKELDRKKNQTLKEEIIEKAKALLDVEPVTAAVAELKKLHDEYKHVGPVPQEVRPQMWETFKEVSDQIHSKKKEVAEAFKVKLAENLEKKKMLITQLEGFTSFNSDKISEWNDKSKEVQEVQKNWKAIGPVPREIAKEISKTFWMHFKTFFKNKQQFFKVLDAEREKNYELKVQICETVEKINEETEEFPAKADKVKRLQQDWRKIGPAPRKKSEDIYKRFKKACDAFFGEMRGQLKGAEKEYEKNLEDKRAICTQLESLTLSPDSFEEVSKLVEKWADIGFVPRKNIRSSKEQMEKILDNLLAKAEGFESDDKEMKGLKLKTLLMKNDVRGGQHISDQIEKIRRQIKRIKEDTDTLKTNIEFFAASKGAEKLKDEVQKKIDTADEKIDALKNKIKILRQMEA